MYRNFYIAILLPVHNTSEGGSVVQHIYIRRESTHTFKPQQMLKRQVFILLY